MTGNAPTLLHVFSTFTVGGPQIRFAQIVNHLGRRYRHLIVAMDGATQAFARLSSDLDAELLHVPVRRGDTLGNLRTFRRILTGQRPDLLVTSNWGTIEWGMANLDGRVPHLHLEDGFGPEEAAGQLARRVWTRRLVLRRTRVVVPSLTLLALARDRWRLAAHRLSHIPNGIECGRFARPADPAFAARFGIDPARPVIGTVAALRPEKNLGRLIDAVARLGPAHPAQLVIVGDGPARADLTAQAAALGLAGRVVFTGACPTPERLIPSFTVFALSSDTEQMPLSLLEAMAAGRAVVATDVGDVRSMLAPANQPFLTDRTAPALARAIGSLLDQPAAIGTIGAANAQRCRDTFDQSRMVARYARLFDAPRAPPDGAGEANAAPWAP